MSPAHLRKLGIPRKMPEDRQGLFITRRSGSGHYSGWQDTEGNRTHTAIHLPIQQTPQSRRLGGYGSSSSAPPTPQKSISMEHGQLKVKPGFKLGRTWGRLPEDISQRNTLQGAYGNNQSLEYQHEAQNSGGKGSQDKE
ncbi:hypothetical protein O181_068824 [Austropuccinia psidii MF-1]|uniref:Uncharacterized protein n=1 Tax=Austropuccinia psidii MF-1 TaxID=1389203 RepID=A0A9Q3EXL4_9BASI|nr:hypothetical protein [Austropuccinia psidii MF-1]